MTRSDISGRAIRTWADWEAAKITGKCTEAEEKLVAACLVGEPCTVGTGQRPRIPTDQNTVGADLLRYLIAGGCEASDLDRLGVSLAGAYIQGALDLNLVRAVGAIQIVNCYVEAPIDAQNARLKLLKMNGSHCHGLDAQGAEVQGAVFLRNGFSSQGEVCLSSAVIGGQLACEGGRFENANGFALNAQGADVKGGVFLRNGFCSRGEVSLSGAVISGQLACEGGRFENAHGDALNAEGADVKGDVFLREGFSSQGEVSLSGAVIGGQLECAGGHFENANGFALNAQDADVKGAVFLRNGFSSKGEIRLSGAVIGGQLECDGGRFENANGSALSAQYAQMTAFFWKDIKACKGHLNLAGANAENLSDDAASWALVDRVYLDGFHYKTIHGQLDAPSRLAWLATACSYDRSFSPQPYEQFAKVLKDMGRSELRRIILIEKEKLLSVSNRDRLDWRRRFGKALSRLSTQRDKASFDVLVEHFQNMDVVNAAFADEFSKRFALLHDSWPNQVGVAEPHPTDIALAQAGFRQEVFWQNLRIGFKIAWLLSKDWSLRWVVGYGYRPGNSVWTLIFLIGIGWGVTHVAYKAGDFAPNSAVILTSDDWQTIASSDSDNPAKEWAETTVTGRDYESFSAVAYAVDVVIPVVAIGQEAAWAPSTERGPWGATLWWLRWLLTGAGWIVTALGAAAITGLIRRD